MEQNPERIKILNKIKELEKNKLFDQDVENDPPCIPIKPGEVDYTRKKLSSKIKSRLADFISFRYISNSFFKDS